MKGSTADLNSPTPEDFDIHAQLVEETDEIIRVHRETLDPGATEGIQADLVRLRSQRVLRLRQRVRPDVQRLAGGAEARRGFCDFVHRGDAGAAQLVELEHGERDALVLAGAIQRIDDIAHRRLPRRLAGELLQGALHGIGIHGLDQRTAGCNDQRDVVLDTDRRTTAVDHPGEEQAEREAQQEKEAVDEAEDARHARGEAAEQAWFAR